jgi:hypothetical protein
MLTPAEELGLSGLSLASKVRNAFHKIPEAQLVELLGKLRDQSLRRRLVYLRDGTVDPVPLFAYPLTVLPEQFGVRELLRISPKEERCLWDCWGPQQRDHHNKSPTGSAQLWVPKAPAVRGGPARALDSSS